MNPQIPLKYMTLKHQLEDGMKVLKKMNVNNFNYYFIKNTLENNIISLAW